MEATIQRQSIAYRPLGFFLAVLLGAVLWSFFYGNTSTFVFIAIVILFVIGLDRPVWAMGAFLISQMTVPGYFVGAISLRLLLLILMGLIVWREYMRYGLHFGENAKRVILPVAVLIAISVVANTFNSDFDFVFKDFRNMITGLLIVVFIPVVVRNMKDLKRLCGVVIVTMTISAVVALLQHYNIAGMEVYSPRASGISQNELQVSYLLCVAFMAVLGVLIAEKIKKGNRRFLITAILMVPAIYFTYTRSALIALVFGAIAMFLFIKTRIRSEIILIVVLILTLYLSASGVTDNFTFGARSQVSQEGSSISRKILWQAGLAIGMDNPILGIGRDQYEIVAPQYAESVDPALIQWEEDRYYSYRTLGSISIHNDFLNMWVSYGVFALVAFLWIALIVLRNFMDAYKRSDQLFIKGLAVGLAAGLITYIINAFYHNLLAEFSLFWIIAGFSLALLKLTPGSKAQADAAQKDVK